MAGFSAEDLPAIEGHFSSALLTALEITGTRKELEEIFLTRPAADWQDWARQHGIPLAVLDPAANTDKATAA